MAMVGSVTCQRGWFDLWLAITGRRRRAEPQINVEVTLRDIDLAALGGFDGQTAYGLEADRREGRPSQHGRLREPVGF